MPESPHHAAAELQKRVAELSRIGQIGGWYYDRERQVSWWSPELYRLFGLAPPDSKSGSTSEAADGPTYEQFLERVHPDDRERVRQSYSEAILLERELRHEFRVVRPDGVTIWIEGFSQPQRDAAGKLIRYEGTNHDITLQKWYEFEAREQSLQLRNTFDSLSEGILTIGFDFRIQYLNRSAARSCGSTPEALIGQLFVGTSDSSTNTSNPSTDSRRAAEPGQSPTLTEHAEHDESRRILQDCMVHRKSLVLESVSDFCGRLRGVFDIRLQPVPEGLLILSNELTDLQRADQQLREKDEELNAFFDTSNAGMCECSFEGTILKVNDTGCRMLGYDRAELLGLKTWQIVDAVDRQDSLDKLAELASGARKSYQAMRRYTCRDGSVLFVMVYASVNRRANQRPVSFVVVFTDMSAQIKLEERVRQAEKMQAIGRLAGGVAHDFNNLLTVILGASKLIERDESLPEKTREHAEAISQAGVRGAALTQQLLTYSRRQSPSMQTIEVNTAIRSAELVLRRIAGEHVELQFALASMPLFIMADPVQFQQVVMNLVVNARDAMSGTGIIRLRSQLLTDYEWPDADRSFASSLFGPQKPPTNNAVEVAVIDNGSGIEPDVLKRMYDPFFTTKEVGQGSGLGLAVVQGIIEECQGRIEVETAIGQGTTMKLLFATVHN